MLEPLVERLLQQRTRAGVWEGRLSSSALSTATAAIALAALDERTCVDAGLAWLVTHQNADGGWGDTIRSRSNISTTALVWAALSYTGREPRHAAATEHAASWLRSAAGAVTPAALRAAILRRYGKDRTFSVPILTVLALTGRLGTDTRAAWRLVPQLPFELAAVPHRWFQHLRLPVVSYALPALIAIGQVRHHHAPSRNPATRAMRSAVRQRTHALLRAMQPESGGYLEATPLTSFVVMSLASMGWRDSPVVQHGARFLRESMREDGSWPIDTHLATWVTTLAVRALEQAGAAERIDAPGIRDWLLAQQSDREHPFTHAAPGAWAWTPLSGGVPDADDTAGALVALRRLGASDERTRQAARDGVRWLLDVQNADGGVPTFCRGWGTLPFDRSTPEITAHAVEAWTAWDESLDAATRSRLAESRRRALAFLERAQRADGSWVPLWFGNEEAAGEENPTYGTARVLTALATAADASPSLRRRGLDWLLASQNADGGWGGDRGVRSSIEETGVALTAICGCTESGDRDAIAAAAARGTRWLSEAVSVADIAARPVGLYFAKLWYYEELYPLIFAINGLSAGLRSRRS